MYRYPSCFHCLSQAFYLSNSLYLSSLALWIEHQCQLDRVSLGWPPFVVDYFTTVNLEEILFYQVALDWNQWHRKCSSLLWKFVWFLLMDGWKSCFSWETPLCRTFNLLVCLHYSFPAHISHHSSLNFEKPYCLHIYYVLNYFFVPDTLNPYQRLQMDSLTMFVWFSYITDLFQRKFWFISQPMSLSQEFFWKIHLYLPSSIYCPYLSHCPWHSWLF